MHSRRRRNFLGFTTRTIQRWDKDGKIKVVQNPWREKKNPWKWDKTYSRIKRGEKYNRICHSFIFNAERWFRKIEGKHNGYAREKGYGEIEVLTDIISGLNEKRKNFLKLLEMVSEKKVYKVIVAYEDRLTRFGFETLSRLFSSFGTTIEVINRKEKTHKYNEVVEGVKKLVSG